MKMEFEDAEAAMSSEDVGLAARLSKKTKTQAKEKGMMGDVSPSTSTLWKVAGLVVSNRDPEPKIKEQLVVDFKAAPLPNQNLLNPF